MKTVRIIVAIFLSCIFTLWVVMRIIAGINFERECSGYLKRAADANTIELAMKNLDTALEYIERHRLTEGYTSIMYQTPDEDIGFWYVNLRASRDELRLIKPDAAQLEKTNVLIKLRETLLDTGSTVSVTVPSGISIYPGNIGAAWWAWLSVFGTIGSWAWVIFARDRSRNGF